MKPFAAAVLLAAALVPAAPGTAPPAAAGPARGCDAARLRHPGAPGVREPNELTAAEVDLAETQLGQVDQLTSALRTRGFRVNIPVYFHVLRDGARGNVSDAAIRRQIAALNTAYGGGYGGAGTGFSFTLKKITRTAEGSWFREPENHEKAFKNRLHRGGPGTLNLYSANVGDELLGWATFPWKYRGAPRMDGVVVHYQSLPGGPIAHFDRGFSAVHETGHWLGLYHTFQDGCDRQGDHVADTPAERDPTNGCPGGKDTCPLAGGDPVHNFMDYAWDTCMRGFTSGQAARMHRAWTAFR
ncbi:zinc metalloprotease [Actinomadura macrotermitis]|uniref:Peptidase M43 pregnancy-associated plasma-A domain-containing protein n=1 Tax=Actinomadura macrotermitis TaxID=2585200 RepID=A0A7K0C253_9ACTN|nr:hypothetical protein [Actinomadura macrotermitis]